MKPFVALIALAALAACSKPSEPAAEASDSAAADMTATTAAAAAPTPTPGSYAVVNQAKQVSTTVLKGDGSFTDSDAKGKVTAEGKWAVKDGKTCFMPSKGAEECWAESARAADGSFTATNAKGETVKVTPKG
ncbi:MAG: hypothetical protein JF593_09360 [Novosphingobium sp.]|nr:hypothetical protein [Novosphingobium sp.]